MKGKEWEWGDETNQIRHSVIFKFIYSLNFYRNLLSISEWRIWGSNNCSGCAPTSTGTQLGLMAGLLNLRMWSVAFWEICRDKLWQNTELMFCWLNRKHNDLLGRRKQVEEWDNHLKTLRVCWLGTGIDCTTYLPLQKKKCLGLLHQ